MVQILMEAGGDPNLPNSWNGRTALQYTRAKKDAKPLLYDLIFGESALNDVGSIILFKACGVAHD